MPPQSASGIFFSGILFSDCGSGRTLELGRSERTIMRPYGADLSMPRVGDDPVARGQCRRRGGRMIERPSAIVRPEPDSAKTKSRRRVALLTDRAQVGAPYTAGFRCRALAINPVAERPAAAATSSSAIARAPACERPYTAGFRCRALAMNPVAERPAAAATSSSAIARAPACAPNCNR